MAQHHSRNDVKGRDRGRVTQVRVGRETRATSARIFQSRRRHALNLNIIQCSTLFEFEPSLSHPPLVLSPSSSSLASISERQQARLARLDPFPSHPTFYSLEPLLRCSILAPRASLDLPPSPSRVASPLVLFARRVFFSPPPPSPPVHSAVSAPPPRPQAFVHVHVHVHACAAARAN